MPTPTAAARRHPGNRSGGTLNAGTLGDTIDDDDGNSNGNRSGGTLATGAAAPSMTTAATPALWAAPSAAPSATTTEATLAPRRNRGGDEC